MDANGLSTTRGRRGYALRAELTGMTRNSTAELTARGYRGKPLHRVAAYRLRANARGIEARHINEVGASRVTASTALHIHTHVTQEGTP